MAAVYFLDAFAVKENRQNLGCQDSLLPRYREDGGRVSLDMVSDLSLEWGKSLDEVSWEPT